MRYGNLISQTWHETQEGREFTSAILHRNRRKIFGILDSPNFPPHLKPDEACYKILVCGKSGVGKSSLIAKLAGKEVPLNHFETPGIEASTIFWPAKLLHTNQVLLFKYVMWDAGEQAWKKFDHIPLAMKKDADCAMFVFSLTNRATWDDLPSLWLTIGHSAGYISSLCRYLMIARMEIDDGTSKLVIGTRLDQFGSIEVTERDMQHFESAWQIPVLSMANVDGPKLADGKHLDGRAGLLGVAPFMNKLTELLWYRDQLAAGIVREQVEQKPQEIPGSHDNASLTIGSAAHDIDDVSSNASELSEKFRVTLC